MKRYWRVTANSTERGYEQKDFKTRVDAEKHLVRLVRKADKQAMNDWSITKFTCYSFQA